MHQGQFGYVPGIYSPCMDQFCCRVLRFHFQQSPRGLISHFHQPFHAFHLLQGHLHLKLFHIRQLPVPEKIQVAGHDQDGNVVFHGFQVLHAHLVVGLIHLHAVQSLQTVKQGQITLQTQAALTHIGIFPFIGTTVQHTTRSQLVFNHTVQVWQQLELTLTMILSGRLHYQLLTLHLQVVLDGMVNTLFQTPQGFRLSPEHGRTDQKGKCYLEYLFHLFRFSGCVSESAYRDRHSSGKRRL